ncbi:MAG: ParB/RepB/Spo0J family partition protein [Candidatus Paceibacterota bacterium]|jgi:ParB family chromosome partitioning protein
MSTPYVNNAIFWIEIEKVSPNPYQPRREFDEMALKSLAESIRMYGVLQPLVVTRKEVEKDDGGLSVEYELISGERRLRASKLAGLSQVPALIRSGEDGAREKLEIAIIENLQREDLNPVERARSFSRLIKEFGLKQIQVADKVGKSREYVANTLRILALPEEILTALGEGKISEGHTRPLLMLSGRPEEQLVLFKEILIKKLSVRDAESASRRVATDRVRNRDKYLDPAVLEIEKKLNEALGTRVKVDRTNENGGTVKIDFFSTDDLRALLVKLGAELNLGEATKADAKLQNNSPVDDRSPDEIQKEENEDLYSLKNFSV